MNAHTMTIKDYLAAKGHDVGEVEKAAGRNYQSGSVAKDAQEYRDAIVAAFEGGKASEMPRDVFEYAKRMSDGFRRLSIPYEMESVRNAAKASGAKWDRDSKEWVFPSKAVADKFRVMAKVGRDLKPGEEIHSATHRVGSQVYQPGQTFERGGKVFMTVAAAKPERGHGADEDQYMHHAIVRPASEAEAAQHVKSQEVAKLKADLSARVAGPDDDRDRAAFDAETQRLTARLRELTGEPVPAATKEGGPNLEARKAAVGAMTTSPKQRTQAHWDAIASALSDIAKAPGKFRGDEIRKGWTDDEIRNWFEGEVME